MRIMLKAYTYRIHPTSEQQQRLTVQFGHARFVYNHYRALREQTYTTEHRNLRYADCTADLVRLKTLLPWLADADSQVLQQSLKNLDRAYQTFFAGRAGYPRFKSKYDRQSIRYPQRFKLCGTKLYLPKVGWVALTLHRPWRARLRTAPSQKARLAATKSPSNVRSRSPSLSHSLSRLASTWD
jgi:putative transposase